MIRADNAGTRRLSLITAQNGAQCVVGGSQYTTSTGAYADLAPTLTTITSATTTSIDTAPASDCINDYDFVNIKNTFAGSHTMTLQITSGSGGPYPLKTFTLLQDESFNYTHGTGFQTFDSSGNLKNVMPGYLPLTGGTLSGALTGTAGTFSGTVTPQALLDISGASAGQIKFPSTQNPSSNANTLDDYVEGGTWTPSDTSGAGLSLTVNATSKIKIGILVWAFFDITYPATANGADNQVGGLPYTAATVGSNGMPVMIGFSNATTLVRGRILQTSTNMQFMDSSGIALINSALSGKTLRGAALYQASA